ncbi:FER-like protein [Mya arenaria]|uniref:FER-like protein n=1 Tax=Mya arenaria TaxID=6604 RepID=A0ABY7DBE4_MYAAR|nr:FER-like protein [Mya arenaria]
MDKARKFLSKSSNMATDIDHEKCDQHGSENVFFCKKHANVGCGRCLLKEHATCGHDIVDLDDITKDMVDTQLAKHLKSSMEDMSDCILQIEENLSGSQSRNKTSKEACLRELNAYKKKIVDRIEKQTKNAKDAVTDMYNKGEEDIKNVSAACCELKQKITSKKTDFEASIRNNQYKKQYILMTTLKKELETLTSEVDETKQRSITEPISLVCNTVVENWLEDKGSDFIVQTASNRLDANASIPPPLPPKSTRDDPSIECSSDIDDKPDCGEMRMDDILSCLRIGQGYFGEVFKGVCKPGNATVVVKVYKDICTDKMRKIFATQMTKLRTLDHPNLVKYLGIVLESQPIRIVMELLAARNCFITDESLVKISDYGISSAATEEVLPAPKATPDSIYHIMKRCWAFVPRDRILFEEIIEQIDILIKSPPSAEKWS